MGDRVVGLWKVEVGVGLAEGIGPDVGCGEAAATVAGDEVGDDSTTTHDMMTSAVTQMEEREREREREIFRLD